MRATLKNLTLFDIELHSQVRDYSNKIFKSFCGLSRNKHLEDWMEWFYVDWVTKRLVSLTLMLCLINDSLLTPQITTELSDIHFPLCKLRLSVILHLVFNPFDEKGNSGIDTRPSWSCAAISPAGYTMYIVPAIGILENHWTATISLTGVFASPWKSCTQHRLV